MPPKNLFADSSSDDEPVEVAPMKVNRAYAEKYDAVKRKQELQRLTQKYGDVSSSDDTEEDDDAVLVTDEHETEFADLLAKLRTNDPSLKDASVKFFANQPSAAPTEGKKKEFTLKQEFQRGILKAAEGEIVDNSIQEEHRRGLKRATTAAEKSAREAFLKVANEAEDVSEFTVKPAPKSAAPAAATGKAAEKIKNALSVGADDESDRFLMNFFGSEVWRQTGSATYTWEQEAADEQDEIFYDDTEQWEKEYQDKKYRHEEGLEALQIQTFARTQEGLLRAKDTRRKEARERKEERVADAELRATEDLKRLKALKREEIAAFQKKIADIAGLNAKDKKGKDAQRGVKPKKPAAMDDDEEDARVAALLSQAALEEDFDPEAFDKQMGALFNDDYYNAIDEDEMAALEAEDTDFIDSDDDIEDADANAGDDDAAAAAPKPKPKKAKTTRQALQDSDIPEGLQEEADFLYPTQSISAAVSRQTHKGAQGLSAEELEAQLEQKMDEYWRLHYHSVAGGVRTRFKYRDVNPEKFGIEDEEVLMLDDRTLNMIAPFNSYASYLNKQQNTKDRFKALHRRKGIRTLNPERRSRRYKTNTVVIDPDAVTDDQGREIAAAARRLNAGAAADDVDEMLAKTKSELEAKNASLEEHVQKVQDERRADGERRAENKRRDRPAGFFDQDAQAQRGHFSEARQRHGGDGAPFRKPYQQRPQSPQQSQQQQQQGRPPHPRAQGNDRQPRPAAHKPE